MKHLIKFIQIFGFKNGLILALKFKYDRLNNFKVPYIKFPFSLRKGTSDKATFFQVFVKRQYHTKYPDSTSFVIDGGANIGLFTIFIKARYPHAEVVCIEPDPENFEALSKNVKKYTSVNLERAGLWNKNTMLDLENVSDKCAVRVEENENAINGVKSITINEIMEKYKVDRIDVLKLDIEASEKILFESNYESWLPKTKMIVIELHDWLSPGSSNNFFKAVSECFENFSFYQKGENIIIINNLL